MILTKKQQEKILQEYINEKHNTDECSGFIDGINATIKLINKLTIPDVVGSAITTDRLRQMDEDIDKLLLTMLVAVFKY